MIAWLASPLGKLVLKGLLIVGAALAIKYAIGAYQEAIIDRAFAEAEAKEKAAQIVRLGTELKEERARVEVLNGELTAARAAAAARTDVLNRHNLGELLQEKPGMIERRVNSATIEVWRAIEAESREAQ